MKVTAFPIFRKKRIFGLALVTVQKARYFLKILKKKHAFQNDTPPGLEPSKFWGSAFNLPYGGEVEKQLPPQGLEIWGGRENFPPGSRNMGGKSKKFPPAAG